MVQALFLPHCGHFISGCIYSGDLSPQHHVDLVPQSMKSSLPSSFDPNSSPTTQLHQQNRSYSIWNLNHNKNIDHWTQKFATKTSPPALMPTFPHHVCGHWNQKIWRAIHKSHHSNHHWTTNCFFAAADLAPKGNFKNGYDPMKRWYKRNMLNLPAVPHDIPTSALRIYLQDNYITHLPPGTFANVPECVYLHLERNKIVLIYKKSFSGLKNLGSLYLHWNPIINVAGGSFDPLYSLKVLWLSNTRLAILDPNLFINLPRYPLKLVLSSSTPVEVSQWNCSSLCWLKHEEHHGTVNWGAQESTPSCASGDDWSSL